MNYFHLILTLLLGWLCGSIINYLADVLPGTRRLTKAGCAACGHPYRTWEYLLLLPCKACGKHRRLRAVLVLGFSVLLTCAAWLFPPPLFQDNLLQIPPLVLSVPILVLFGVIFTTDMEYHIILKEVSIAGSVIGLATGILTVGAIETLIGGVAGFAIMLAFYYLGNVFSKWMARRRGQEIEEALGFGDVTMSAIIGFFLGWPNIISGLLLAIVLGGLISGGMIVFMLLRKKYEAFTAIPYAPFLIIACLALFYLI